MDREILLNMLRKDFPDGECTHDQLHDWLVQNTWQVLTRCYKTIGELLEDIQDDTYDYIASDLVIGEEGYGLAGGVAREELNVVDDRED